jgi:hypothetical protein
MLSYAKHGRCQANAQGRTRLLSFPAARKQVGGIKARGFGLCGSAFRNVLQASVDHGLCVSARSGCLSAKVSAPRSRSAMVPRTPRRRVAGNRGRRGGCATRFQRFEWRETCVILPEPLEFSSSVRAVGATVRASSLARGGAAAASDWEPPRWKYASSLAAEASAPPPSSWWMPRSPASLRSRMLAINNPRIPSGKPMKANATTAPTIISDTTTPTWRFLRLNQQL